MDTGPVSVPDAVHQAWGESSYLDLHGLKWHVRIAGKGPPLLVLHGFMGSVATWSACVRAWASDYRVIAVDLVGHGQSAVPADVSRYTLDSCVADLEAIADALRLRSVRLLGYSMGGRVALYWALNHPERLAALLLESSSPGIADPQERAARRASDARLASELDRGDLAAFVDRWERLPLFATERSLPPQARKALREERLANNPAGLANSLRGMGAGSQPSLWGCLSKLEVPTLVVAGEHDTKYVAIAQATAKALPNAECVVIEGAGHAVHRERPDVFTQCVSDFLRRRAPGP